MLTQLTLTNFKCFNNQKIPLKKTSIIVGQNNAGKSTIVEALRLVSLVTRRFGHSEIRKVPSWLDEQKSFWGISPSLTNQDLNFARVFHRYGEPSSKLTARFSTGSSLSVYIGGQDKIHGVLFDPDGNVVTSIKRFSLPQIAILPQISPLNEVEEILTPQYVKNAASSPLASLHFRNQLNLFYDEAFQEFKELAEATWHGLQIKELKSETGREGSPLQLLIRNDDFVAEVSWMGHGLQMWLQTMWFLARCKDYDTVILDEPDVYMHADLQRKLIRVIQERHQQVIIATHSVEIMSEVDSSSVLIVDRGRRKAKFANDLPGVQSIIDEIGGVHNLQLARLWHSKKCLFVEGKDIAIMKQVQNKLFPDSALPLDTIPNLSVGGWGGWNYVIGSAMLMKENFESDFLAYAMFDRDFHTQEQIRSRMKKANDKEIHLHIWKLKEIENYLIIPEVIQRVIQSGTKSPPTAKEVKDKIFELCDGFKEKVLDGFVAEFFTESKAGGAAGANRLARAAMKNWDKYETRIAMSPGKDLIGKISGWSKKKFNVSFGVSALLKEIQKEEIPSELAGVLTAIEESSPFQ